MVHLLIIDVPGFSLIIGAASGIGKACAQGFVNEGAAGLALLDVNHDALLSVKAELEERLQQRPEAKPCQINVYPVDISSEDQVNQVVEDAASKFGRLDYVVNAAGIAVKHEGGAAFAQTPDWQRVLDVNLNGTFFILRAAAKVMLKQDPILPTIDGRPLQRGSVVNFSSIQGLVGIPLSTAYAATKSAV